MPEYDMAQFGSVFSTDSKMARDSANQKECRSATASLNCVLTAGLQEVSKLTVPMSFGAIPPCSCCCANAGRTSNEHKQQAVNKLFIFRTSAAQNITPKSDCSCR